MKKVLIVSYPFPPTGGVGVQRTVKFVKYLPQFEWESIVLTVKKKDYSFYDNQILKELPPEIPVYRVSCFEPENYSDDFTFKHFSFKKLAHKLIRNFFRFFDFIFTPDEKTGWIIPAALKGASLVIQKKIDLVYVTGDPFSTFFVGHYIKKLTKVPLVVDFRDEWTQGYLLKHYQRKYKWQPKVEAWQEQKIIKSADIVISVTPKIIESFKRRYGQFKDKFYCIPNGFDETDFIVQEKSLVEFTKSDKFTILHLGKVYSLRSPEVFLKAVQEIIKEKEDIKDKLKIVFLGEISSDCQNLFNELLSSGVVELKSFSPHRKALQMLQKADLALLILDKAPEAERVYTAKIFDYLGARKPVLAIAPESSQVSQLIKQTNAGMVAQTSKDIKEKLLLFYDLWKNNQLEFKGNYNFIQQFTRRNLTAKLAQIFDNLIKD